MHSGLPGWSQLVEEAEHYELEGTTIRSTLIDLKRRRGSNQVLADIETIERLSEL